VMARELADLLIVVVTLTMAVTPLLVLFNERVVQPWLRPHAEERFDIIDDIEHQVVIAGFGRFGQVTGRLLHMKQIPFTAIESSPEQVEVVRRYGNKVYYGDPGRLDLLRAARLDKAKVFVLTISDVVASVKAAELVRRHFPNVVVYARARNRHHAHLLMDVGVKYVIRETWLSALDMGRHVLDGLGESEEEAQHAVETFQRHDEQTLIRQHAIHHDEQKLIQSSKDAALQLQELFEADVASEGQPHESGTT
jgi:voltage-gated potassium channel Kch